MEGMAAILLFGGSIFILVSVMKNKQNVENQIAAASKNVQGKDLNESVPETKYQKQKSQKIVEKISDLKPQTDIVQQAEIAKKVLSELTSDSINQTLEVLTKTEDKINAVKVHHERFRDRYSELLEITLSAESGEKSRKKTAKIVAQTKVDVDKCMEIGLAALLRRPELNLYSDETYEARVIKSKIEKTHSWKDLQKEF